MPGFPSSPLYRPLRAPEWQRKMLAAWALSPARPTPIHPRRERRGFPAFFGESKEVIKRGFDDTEPARQRYACSDCHKRFDDLTDMIFAGHHQPLKVWLLCLYFMGLNLSNEPIAHELSINASDAYLMTTEWRGSMVKK